MSIHLQREIETLKKKILSLGARVEKSLRDSITAYKSQSIHLAEIVIDYDSEIDLSEVEIEEDCLKILALHQPVAGDLRFIIAALKINNELERIGDLSANIARRVIEINQVSGMDFNFDFDEMVEIVKKMLQESLNSLIHLDFKLAQSVLQSDDSADQLLKILNSQIADKISNNPEQAQKLIQFISIPKQLERIADCTTNIAEDVIYMIKGQIVRHNIENQQTGQ